MTASTIDLASANPELAPAEQISAQIARLLNKHGRSLLEDRRRVLGLLRDYEPQQTRGIRLLMTAYDQNVPQDLAALGHAPDALALEQAEQSLIADTGIQADLAHWAVTCWYGALFSAAPVAKHVALETAIAAPASDTQAPKGIYAPTIDPASGGSTIPSASAASVAVAVPLVGAAASSVAPPPATDDLTWGDSDIRPAPAAQLAVAPTVQNAALAQPAVAPVFAATAQTAPKPPFWKRHRIITALVCIAGFGYLSDFIKNIGSPSTSTRPPVVAPVAPTLPPTRPPVAAPVVPAAPHTPSPTPTPTPAPVVAPVAPVAKPAAAPSFPVLSLSDDAANWPKFFAGSRLPETPNSWTFAFNFQSAGRYYVHRVNVAFPDNLTDGQGTMRSNEIGATGPNVVAQTASFPVTRSKSANVNVYVVQMNSPGWAQNPAAAPPVCVVFSSGSSPLKFEPEKAFFCVTALENTKCGANLGCGQLD